MNKKLHHVAMAGLLAAGACASQKEKTEATVDAPKTGECWGINACKGKGACGGPGHECAGQNTCKGKGWLKLSKEECVSKKGTYKQ